MRTNIYIDASNFYYRILFATGTNPELATDSERDTYYESLAISMFNMLNRFGACNEVYFVKDHISWRKSYMTEYKKERQNDDKGINFDNMQIVSMRFEDFLRRINARIISCENCEADDVIFYKVKNDKYVSVIVSGDNDFNQLISDTCFRYDAINNTLITPDSLMLPEVINVKHSTKTVVADKERAKKIICGCKSDEVPGIYGIGDVKFEKIYQALKQNTDGNVSDYIMEHVSDVSKAILPFLGKSTKVEPESVPETLKINIRLTVLSESAIDSVIMRKMSESLELNTDTNEFFLPSKNSYLKAAGIYKPEQQQETDVRQATLFKHHKLDDDMSFIKN